MRHGKRDQAVNSQVMATEGGKGKLGWTLSGIHNSQGRMQPKCPLTDEWIKKVHYMYSAIKK